MAGRAAPALIRGGGNHRSFGILLSIAANLRRYSVGLKLRTALGCGTACLYTLGQWKSLRVYLEGGRVETDGNGVGNAVHPCALGKKNCLLPSAANKTVPKPSLAASAARQIQAQSATA